MLDDIWKAGPIAIWGAVLATILAAIRLWETFFRDRVRLTTSFFWTGQQGSPDTITVVNLGSIPVTVSHWKLVWEPKLLSGRRNPVDVSPDFSPDDERAFKLSPHETWTTHIFEPDKFNWNGDDAKGRRLMLYLHVFGRKKPIRLAVT